MGSENQYSAYNSRNVDGGVHSRSVLMPKLEFPKFDGENPILWRDLCDMFRGLWRATDDEDEVRCSQFPRSCGDLASKSGATRSRE
jgi:hypothetical protein